MRWLDDYISEREGRAFKKQLPRLQKRLGEVDWPPPTYSYCISGNTLRAFPGCHNRPRDLVDGWAERVWKGIEPSELAKAITSKAGFEKWHDSLHTALKRRWRYYEGEVPSLAHRLKLVDLLIKWLSQHNFGSDELKQAFEKNAHCALDSQVLSKLNACYSCALPLRNPSMGDIVNMNTYLICQKLVERFSNRFGGTPLLFDYYAWQRGGAK